MFGSLEAGSIGSPSDDAVRTFSGRSPSYPLYGSFAMSDFCVLKSGTLDLPPDGINPWIRF
jgi:hypothetical protein